MKTITLRNTQRGVALVIGLMLVAVASLGALSMMRGTILQERLTSNQQNKIIANMAAEAGAGRFLEWIGKKIEDLEGSNSISITLKEAWENRDEIERLRLPQARNANPDFPPFGYFWISEEPDWTKKPLEVTVIGESWMNELLAETQLLFSVLVTADLSNEVFHPYADAGVVGCEGVATRGSGQIDSYNSGAGSYNAANPGRDAHVLTTSPSAMVELTGNAPIYGSVNSTGSVSATGSSPVYGDINATGLVSLKGGGVKVYGNVKTAGDVSFESSAEVHGNVSANGNIAFNNWSARVTGNAKAGGEITSRNNNKPPEQHVGGSVQAGSNPGNSGVAQTPCDPLDVDGIVSEFDDQFSTGSMNIGPWTYRYLKLSPDGVDYYDPTWNVQSWKTDNARTMQDIELFGRETRFLKVSHFALGQNGSLEVTGGDVVLMVDGDMSIGGNTEITIAPGSSLTVLLTGKFDLQGSVKVNNQNPIDANGKLPFSLFSSYEQTSNKGNNDGVRLRGNTDFTAVIYAPKSHVSVTGSGSLFGQVRGKSVEATGAGGIHYDVRLGTFSVPTSESVGNSDVATVQVTSWNVVFPLPKSAD
ncbi:hypothetical protein CKO25_07630 [Thiocapsa imhoffii]|uniref:Type 4 fimbrial biogenesis protein PilX N-terminal domain-containing protein n=1 Tax=Thiocapsa imhoffii TaxID=382777 RepID=A0A9X1B8Z5_9GAMM|nr:pilus assembly PilX N-terminal domain-containing protein [Thiocapsa imhoffii]MBK1644526.1 hypothetical protein [Thiocapsa imhoffii]